LRGIEFELGQSGNRSDVRCGELDGHGEC
jgi:hypothetical protein